MIYEEFEIINSNGIKEKYYIVNNFNMDNDSYIVYTDNLLNENGDINIYINRYDIKDNNLILLQVNKNKKELVNKKWEQLCQEV